MSLYGGLLRLYPRAFRDEYGEDMALLLRHQLRDESAARVWARTLLDLAITVPTLRLEAHMSARTSAPVAYTAAAVASLVVAVVAGTSIGVSVVGVGGVLLFGGLALISWRRAQTLGSVGGASAWKLVAVGGGGLTGTVVLVNVNGELSSGWWAVFMVALLTSITLTAVGLALAITHVSRRRTA